MYAAATLAALVLSLTSTGDPPEWGGFRGNNGCGVASSKGIPEALDPEANILWRTEVPDGYSSPIVAGENVFITGSEGSELSTVCLERYTGAVRWQTTLEFNGKRIGQNSPAAPTPVTDGERLYVLFDAVGLLAYDMQGEELWRAELGKINIPHGLATSPLLHGDAVIVLVDQDRDAFLAAFDKNTGKELWRAERPGVTHGYSTPAIYTPESGPAQVVVSGSLQIAAYSVTDGKKLWWVDGASWQTKSVPVFAGGTCYVNAFMLPSSEFGVQTNDSWEEVLTKRDADGDGMVSKDEWDDETMRMLWPIFDLNDDGFLEHEDYEYIQHSGSSSGGLFAIDMSGKGDVTASHVKWTFDDRRGLPDCPSPLLLDGQLYMIKEGGVMTAFDTASGEVSKQARVAEPDRYFASPVAAAGRIVTASVSGQLAVIATGSAGGDWEVLSVNNLDEEIWSTPAIAGEQVFVRTAKALYCFQSMQED
ncbi:MAG: outer membrane protein assembly factor BamB [Chlamydiales bacterium]|jgi:outer membrane protein assembly factor BamB